jgi:cytidyltransferase-like protein
VSTIVLNEEILNLHLYVVASGVGTKIQDSLWMIPGTSSFLVGASFPYATDDTDEFLGFKPASYCNREEALQLAMEAFMRAQRHQLAGEARARAVGIAVSGAVASARGPLRRGSNRIHVAVVSSRGALHREIPLPKPENSPIQRMLDNDVATTAVTNFLEYEVGIGCTPESFVVPEEELREIFFKHPYFSQSGARFADVRDVSTFFPGSFNPLHEGHQLMVAETEEQGDLVSYTVCADSVHKRSLTVVDMLTRAAQFRLERLDGNCGRVLFTQGDPLFVDKFKANPGSKFLMGVDTFIRMLDPKWGPARAAVLKSIEDNQIHVQVSDRVQGGITTRAADAIRQLVPILQRGSFDILDQIPPDVSSTELRLKNVC